MKRQYEINLLLETGSGGSARHVFDLYRGLKRRGQQVRLIISLQRADQLFQTELRTIDPDDVYQIGLHRSPHPTDFAAISRILQYLRKRPGLQIVHAHSTKAGAVAAMFRSNRIATLFTPHAYRGMDSTLAGWQRIVVRKAESIISNAHQKVIAVSPAEYEYASGLGIPNKRLALILNGVDLHGIREAGRRSRQSDSGNAHDIGFVGRLVHQKQPLTFLKALEVMKESGFPFRGHIIGDGPLRSMLEKHADVTGLRPLVTFYGAVKAIPLMARFDVVLHTSIYEGLPYSLLEAVALEIPIVAVANAGCEGLFGERLPLISSHLQYVEMAHSAMRICVEPAIREDIRSVYREIDSAISVDTMVDKIEAEYDLLWHNYMAKHGAQSAAADRLMCDQPSATNHAVRLDSLSSHLKH